MPGPHPPATRITLESCADTIGVNGMALAMPAPIRVLARNAAAISLVMGSSPPGVIKSFVLAMSSFPGSAAGNGYSKRHHAGIGMIRMPGRIRRDALDASVGSRAALVLD
jgi:hypothetical protein